MRPRLIGFLLSLALCAQATALSFKVDGSYALLVATDEPGSSVAIYPTVFGLGQFRAPSLSGYSIELEYDPAFLQVAYAQIDDRPRFNSVGPRYADISTPGRIKWSETSSLTPAQLHARQPAAFELMDIFAYPLQAGSTTIDVVSAEFYDQDRVLMQNVVLQSLSILIMHVPDVGGSAGLLFGATALVLASYGSRRGAWMGRQPALVR